MDPRYPSGPPHWPPPPPSKTPHNPIFEALDKPLRILWFETTSRVKANGTLPSLPYTLGRLHRPQSPPSLELLFRPGTKENTSLAEVLTTRPTRRSPKALPSPQGRNFCPKRKRNGNRGLRAVPPLKKLGGNNMDKRRQKGPTSPLPAECPPLISNIK